MKRFVLSTLALLLSTLFVEGFAQRMQLSPEQRAERLKDSLSLTDEQFTKIVEMYAASDDERRALLESAGGDRQSMREAMRTLLDHTDAKIEVLLSIDQKEKFSQMRKRQMERRQDFRRRND